MSVQESKRASNNTNQRRSSPRHLITKMTKTKDKERILKAATEKQIVTCKGNTIRTSVYFFGRNFAGQKVVAKC